MDKPSPELNASFPSMLIFSWFDAMVKKGYKKPLESDDLYNLKPRDSSAVVNPTWSRNWNKQVEKDRVKKVPQTSILIPMFRTFALPFMQANCYRFVNVLLQLVNIG